MLFENKNPEKALKYFDKGISLLPNEETLLAVRGLCKYEMGDIEGAKNDWNRLKIPDEKNAAKLLTETSVNYSQLSGYSEMMTFVNK